MGSPTPRCAAAVVVVSTVSRSADRQPIADRTGHAGVQPVHRIHAREHRGRHPVGDARDAPGTPATASGPNCSRVRRQRLDPCGQPTHSAAPAGRRASAAAVGTRDDLLPVARLIIGVRSQSSVSITGRWSRRGSASICVRCRRCTAHFDHVVRRGWRKRPRSRPARGLPQEVAHCPHRFLYVMKEALEGWAKVVQAGSPSGVRVKRSFGQPPWQAKRTSHSRQ